MIDLHAHVLAGIDDGPATMAEAVEAVASAAREGVHTLAATPHVRPDHPAVKPEELAARTAELRASCAQAGIEIELVSGGEVDLTWAQRADDEALAAASYAGNGRDLLIETPYSELPAGFEELVLRVAARGFRVLLAHPERNPTLQRNPGRLATLLAHEVLVQVTAGALLGPRSSRSRRMAAALVDERQAHVLASDRHGAAIRRAGLREGVEVAGRAVGAHATWMVTDAPAAILAGLPLPPPPAAAPSRRRSLWRRGA